MQEAANWEWYSKLGRQVTSCQLQQSWGVVKCELRPPWKEFLATGATLFAFMKRDLVILLCC